MVWTQGWLFNMAKAFSLLLNMDISSGFEEFTLSKIWDMLPCKTIRPCSIMPMLVHSSDSSDSIWELTISVFPCSLSSFSMVVYSTLVLGSRPEAGSSRISKSGS